MIDSHTLKHYRELAENTEMVCSLGEYTPPEFLELLDYIDELQNEIGDLSFRILDLEIEADRNNEFADPG